MKKKPDESIIEAGLKHTALTSESVKALVACGIPAVVIAEAAGVSVSTLRNRSSQVASPRLESAETLDYIRATMQLLTSVGMPSDRAGHWIRSRESAIPFDRPIEIIGDNPDKVLDMARDYINENYSKE